LPLQLTNIWLRDLPDIVHGKAGYDFAIWITYEDTLSQPAVTRQTRLVQRFGAYEHGGTSFAYVGAHNCADDDCP
jgi:hypothetical protein